MATFDRIVQKSSNFKGYTGNPPTTEEEYNDLDCWTDPSTKPTWAEVSADMALEDTRSSRKNEYPSIGDQLDMIYHAGLGGDEFQAAIKAVKDKYPKG